MACGSQPAVVGAAEDAQQRGGVDAAAPGDAVLAVGGEGHVAGLQRPAGADLRGLLAQQRHPEAELALALQRRRLPVEAADQHHVAVERLEGGGVDVRDVRVVGRAGHPLPLGGQQLDEVRALVGAAEPGEDVLAGWPGWGADGDSWRVGGDPVVGNGHGCLLGLPGAPRFVADPRPDGSGP